SLLPDRRVSGTAIVCCSSPGAPVPAQPESENVCIERHPAEDTECQRAAASGSPSYKRIEAHLSSVPPWARRAPESMRLDPRATAARRMQATLCSCLHRSSCPIAAGSVGPVQRSFEDRRYRCIPEGPGLPARRRHLSSRPAFPESADISHEALDQNPLLRLSSV